MIQVIWVLVNCNNIKEARLIGKEVLKKRLCSCFDIVPRHSAFYYWPPKSRKIEKSQGAILIIETFKEKYNSVVREAKKLHSDKLPFIGFIRIEGISKDYLIWMRRELRQ
jgi:uncharacterized protein involved in tolerance to divalent cations